MPRELQPPQSPQPELTASPAEMLTPERDEAMTIPDQHRRAAGIDPPGQAAADAGALPELDVPAHHDEVADDPHDSLFGRIQQFHQRHDAEANNLLPEHQQTTAEAMGILETDMLLDEWPPRPGGINGHALQDADVVNMLRRFDEHEPLHPYVATLGIGDLEACVALEEAAMAENERCSRERFQYRLTVCPSLCLGLFTSTNREPDDETRACFAAARAPDSSKPAHKSLLIGHVIATLTNADYVTDSSMSFPPDFFKPLPPSPPGGATTEGAADQPPSTPAKVPPPVPQKDQLPTMDQSSMAPGHHPLGRTVAIHSVCILPPFQHLNLGKIMLRGYLQRIEGSGIADTAALLSHQELAGWYTSSFGFVDKGESPATFGGGGWRDLRYDFAEPMSSV